MLLKIKKLTPILIASTGAVALSKEIKETVQENKNDKTKSKPDPFAYDKSTGWERVKTIFAINEYGERSADFAMIVGATAAGGMAGIMIGATKRSRKTTEEFMEKNDASKFQNMHEARKELARLLTKEMLRGVWENAPRLAFICGGFTFVSTTLAAYRGKSGILENITAGCIMGGLYRFNYGIRGMLVGVALGSVFGTIFGISHSLLLKLFGDNLEQSRRDFHNFYYYGDRKFEKNVADYEMKKEHSAMELEKVEKLRHLPLTLDHLDDTSKEAS